MFCLIVIYSSLDSNSGQMACSFARGLKAFGWNPCIASPHHFESFEFFEINEDGTETKKDISAGSRRPEALIFWTPRTPIWRFLSRFPELRGERIVLHLEDDETQILAMASRASFETVQTWGLRRWMLRGFQSWSHPGLARGLAETVDGVTAVSPALKELVSDSVPFQFLRPPITDSALNLVTRETERGLIVYAGAIHPAVEEDFAELGKAVGMLKQNGRFVRFVRCGPPIQGDIRGRLPKRGCEFEDLGYLIDSDVHELLGRSEVLVQPGLPNDFNRRRLPAKLLQYFASGRPVIMPGCYGWLGFEDGKDAIVCTSGNAEEIAEKCAWLFDDRERGDSIGRAGRAKALEVFDPKVSAAQLDRFLRELCSRDEPERAARGRA